MSLYGTNRRNKGRAKREFGIKIKTAKEHKQVYTIDLSSGGVRVGAPMLRLMAGEPVEITIEQNGNAHTFSGQVNRVDGMVRINRISRDVNAYFIRIIDELFIEFVKKHFSV